MLFWPKLVEFLPYENNNNIFKYLENSVSLSYLVNFSFQEWNTHLIKLTNKPARCTQEPRPLSRKSYHGWPLDPIPIPFHKAIHKIYLELRKKKYWTCPRPSGFPQSSSHCQNLKNIPSFGRTKKERVYFVAISNSVFRLNGIDFLKTWCQGFI